MTAATTWEQRLLLGVGEGRPDLAHHQSIWGPLPQVSRRDLLDAVSDSGLLGRGGAGFPIGRKLRTVAAGGKDRVVVANGAEGEPASAKDRLLLLKTPHLVLDGIQLAAHVVGAREAFLVVHRESGVTSRLYAAIQERRDPITVQLRELPAGYVASEETAVVSYLNGGEAKPSFTPPRPFEAGVRERPTLINNVETLAHLATIARFGPAWFRSVGDVDEPGTLLVTVSRGSDDRTVAEVPTGTPIAEVLLAADVDVANTQAVLVGGYFGTWLPAELAMQLPLSQHALRAVGGGLGAGVLAPLPVGHCGLTETARVARYLAQHSAGQCGPCLNGLPAIANALDRLTSGSWDDSWWPALERWIAVVPGRGACRHPDGAVGFVASALSTFASDLSRHRAGRSCPGSTAPALLPVPRLIEAR